MSASVRPSSRPRRAFTLIELIVAVVVLGLLAALAVPALSAVQRRAKIEAREVSMAALAREAAAIAAFDQQGWTTTAWEDAAGDMSGGQPTAATVAQASPAWDVLYDGQVLQAGVAAQVHVDICDDDTAGLAALVPGVDDVIVYVVATYHGFTVTSGWDQIDSAHTENGEGALTFHGFDPATCAGPADEPAVEQPGAQDSPGISNAPEISCDWTHGGQAYCFGRNYNGRIVPADPVDTDYPETDKQLLPVDRVADVRPAPDHVAVVDVDDRVWMIDQGGPRQITYASGDPVIADRDVSITTTTDGPVYTGVDGTTDRMWVGGPGYRGPYATGGSAAADLPDLPGTYTVDDVIEIDCAANFLCLLLTDGTVWCIGYNDHGQLGDSSTIRTDTPATEWVQVRHDATTMLAGGAELALGQYHAAVRHADSTVSAWGRADLGATGDDNPSADDDTPGAGTGTGGDRNVAVAVCDLDTAGGCTTDDTPVLQGATVLYPAGPDHTCVERSGGTYACWGSFDDGSGTVTTQAVPTVVASLPSRWPATSTTTTSIDCASWTLTSATTTSCSAETGIRMQHTADATSQTYHDAVKEEADGPWQDLTGVDTVELVWSQDTPPTTDGSTTIVVKLRGQDGTTYDAGITNPRGNVNGTYTDVIDVSRYNDVRQVHVAVTARAEAGFTYTTDLTIHSMTLTPAP